MPQNSQTFALRGGQWKLVGEKRYAPAPQPPLQPHIGASGDVSAGAGSHKAVQCTTGATAGISPFLVPLIELIDRAIAYVAPAELPGIAEVIESYLGNQITEDQAKCLMRLNGVNWDVWYPAIRARREMPTVPEYIQAARRLGADDDTILQGLRYFGFLDQNEAKSRLLVYDQLPTISDVLHFLQRNVFDPDYVRDFGLMDGFATRFWPRYGPGLRAIGVQQQTAEDHYAAHWINPSIGQLAEMVQRLRPGRVDPSVQFTANDFLRVLAEQDVAPFFRERLRQTSFRTISVRYLQQLAQQHLLDEAELVQRWQDLGNSPKDAPILGKMTWQMGQRQRAQYMKGYTPSVVAKLWPAGQIDRPTAYQVLKPLGMEPADVDTLLDVSTKEVIAAQYEKHTIKSIADYASLAVKAYRDGVVSAADAVAALQRAGYSVDAATLEIQSADLEAKVANINTARKAIRSAFLRGELNAADALNALTLAGVLPGPAATDVSLWTLQLTVPRKAQSRSMILKWAKDGIISVANAETRLLNLGYSPDTVGLDILDLAQTIKAAQAAAASRRAAQLARAQAAAQRALTATQKSFCKLYTPAKMKLWYAERIIDESTYRDRLIKCGYSAEQIQLSFEEAQVARAKRDDESRKKGPSGIEYTGPGADRS